MVKFFEQTRLGSYKIVATVGIVNPNLLLSMLKKERMASQRQRTILRTARFAEVKVASMTLFRLDFYLHLVC